ncbi:hypothetical protein ES288_A06G098700v1 [Gossypium darwinii]|uniref:Uncharacterized protein n=1 Tax=Gossypium darwinii TaxID=34276 RepID=A0A5D2G3S7_GOSDA|nr:hypothetical protein ES288_A06G098700v1 [Gossypium darwinii]
MTVKKRCHRFHHHQSAEDRVDHHHHQANGPNLNKSHNRTSLHHWCCYYPTCSKTTSPSCLLHDDDSPLALSLPRPTKTMYTLLSLKYCCYSPGFPVPPLWRT